jgi:hypothetical protein
VGEAREQVARYRVQEAIRRSAFGVWEKQRMWIRWASDSEGFVAGLGGRPSTLRFVIFVDPASFEARVWG